MENLRIELNYKAFSFEELGNEEMILCKAAQKAALDAYAVYSNFKVGAAVLLENGEIICGNNQENASFPSGICAERTAIFYANAKYPDIPIKILAIAAYSNGEFQKYISPCGICRQVLVETERRFQKPVRILLCGSGQVLDIEKGEDLLPLAFNDENLG